MRRYIWGQEIDEISKAVKNATCLEKIKFNKNRQNAMSNRLKEKSTIKKSAGFEKFLF